jgi:glucose/arabinose dehydrogenase
LGKILRLDLGTHTGPYKIPSTNPFIQSTTAKKEIWDYGLRNPWRFSFDRSTSNIYIADVGQDSTEEVDFQNARAIGGQNYGWNILEGTNCFLTPNCKPPKAYVAPVAEYDHSLGCSVTGGYVYRGTTYGSLKGIYLYGDFCSGAVFGLKKASGTWVSTTLRQSGFAITTFGEDQAGNVYVTDYNTGNIYKIQSP